MLHAAGDVDRACNGDIAVFNKISAYGKDRVSRIKAAVLHKIMHSCRTGYLEDPALQNINIRV